MKAAVNRELINRICVNSAKISGVRMSDAGMPKTSLFHPSLVDYWNFKGKSNSDEDRGTIKGIKGGILTAYNFGWSLGSGYGLYGTDFGTQWNDTDASYGKIINSTIAHTDKVGSGLYVIAYSTLIVFADNFKGRITGMPEGYSLYIGYATNLYLVSPTNGEWSINKADIPYLVPEGSPESNAKYNGGFKIMKTGQLGGGVEVPADVNIELMPDYSGAIVLDGVDDYLRYNGEITLNDYTIIAKRHYMGDQVHYACFASTRHAASNRAGAFAVELIMHDNIHDGFYAYSFNAPTFFNDTPVNGIVYQTKTSYNGKPINTGYASLNNTFYLGVLSNNYTSYCKVAIEWVALYNKSLTEQEIQKEITKIQSL